MSVAGQTLALEGVRCAGCVLKIEKHLAALAGVRHARGNATQIKDVSSGTPEPSLLPRLAVAALGMMNIMAFSVSVWFGLVTDMGHGPALRGLQAGNITMDLPITLAIWLAFAGSLFETLQRSHDVYFDAVVSLIFLLLIGRVLEQAMRRRSDHAAKNLREMLEGKAHRIDTNGQPETIAASALRAGDEIIAYSGEILQADGVLLSRSADLDESALTGEAAPRHALSGEQVVAGAVLLGGPARVCVTHVGEASQMGQMAQMIDDVAVRASRPLP